MRSSGEVRLSEVLKKLSRIGDLWRDHTFNTTSGKRMAIFTHDEILDGQKHILILPHVSHVKDDTKNKVQFMLTSHARHYSYLDVHYVLRHWACIPCSKGNQTFTIPKCQTSRRTFKYFRYLALSRTLEFFSISQTILTIETQLNVPSLAKISSCLSVENPFGLRTWVNVQHHLCEISNMMMNTGLLLMSITGWYTINISKSKPARASSSKLIPISLSFLPFGSFRDLYLNFEDCFYSIQTWRESDLRPRLSQA